jgi:serine/threonine protein kinase/tetratricopeptide (TPR) repeat protein
MKLGGLTDSTAGIADEVLACRRCGSSARIGSGLCVSCLLQPALEGSGTNGDTLAAMLAEIDLDDADWRVGNYQILEEIGRGGMGVIYRARQRHSRRIVALKRVLSYHSDSRETLARFRREAEAAASLDHPNILPIYEVGETEDKLPFFSMKLAVGGALLNLKQTLRNDPREIVRLLSKVTRAVQYAHGQGILHRDLKPANILLDGRGEPLVSDFGLAKWLDASSDLTRTLTVFGTPGYIAPEQANGPAADLKPSADLYSMGAILFDLIAGRPPFLGEHALAVINQAREKPAPKLRSVVPNADRDLETICARCLEREPSARYQSAHDLATDLELWLEGRPILARPVSPPIRVWRWSKRNPKLGLSIAACVALAAAAVVFQVQNRLAERASVMAMHSIAVEPFLDLDSAKYDANVSGDLASALQSELGHHGPARVTPVSPSRSTTGAETDAKRWNDARSAIQGTKRIRDGKLRISLRLLNTADGKALYKKIVEAPAAQQRTDALAKLTATDLYAILDTRDLGQAELAETDPGWRDEDTRQLLIAGRAVENRKTVTADIERSIELYRKAVNAQPQSALAYAYLAESEWAHAYFTGNAKSLSAAETCANMALQLNRSAPESHKAASVVFFQQGRFYESLEEAFTSVELANDVQDYRLINRIPGNFRMVGQPNKALPWYLLTFKNDSRPYDAYALAECYLELGDDDSAAAQYKRAASLFPELPEGWIGLCRLELFKRNFTTAQRIASENWITYRDFALSEQMAAQVAFYSRDFAQAEKLYRELATNNPDGGGSLFGAVSYQSALGRLRLDGGDKAAGARMLSAALAKEFERLRSAPNHPEILYRVSAIEASLGRTEPALQHLVAAIDVGWIDYRSLELDPRFDRIRDTQAFKDTVTHLTRKVQEMRRQLPADIRHLTLTSKP